MWHIIIGLKWMKKWYLININEYFNYPGLIKKKIPKYLRGYEWNFKFILPFHNFML